MNTSQYDAYLQTLLQTADNDPHVLGVIGAGSTANAARRDQWSDHDFLWVVESGLQEGYRQNLAWLPDSDNIVLRFRETEHGLKVMYANTHLIEFAVFDLDELRVMRVNDYAVLLDKADIGERMKPILEASAQPPVDVLHETLYVLSLLQVATGRFVRGERLSAHVFIKSYALGHLLKLLAALIPSDHAAKLDNLDAFRRFEQVYPQLGVELYALTLQDGVTCAEGFVNILEREAKPRLADFPQAALDALRRHFVAVRAS